MAGEAVPCLPVYFERSVLFFLDPDLSTVRLLNLGVLSVHPGGSSIAACLCGLLLLHTVVDKVAVSLAIGAPAAATVPQVVSWISLFLRLGLVAAVEVRRATTVDVAHEARGVMPLNSVE